MSTDKTIEYLKCRKSIFYFIYNYVKISQVGGSLQMSPDNMHPRMIETIKSTLVYHRCMLMATRQLGKALSLDTPIPKPNGKWTTMGDLQVGDTVLGSDGNPTKVISATDVMANHDCYKVNFDYADPIIADADHLWDVNLPAANNFSDVITTKDLKQMMVDHRDLPYIECCNAIDNDNLEFEVDPYWLGFEIGGDDHTEYQSVNKYIPREYFSGSKDQRIELLRGIMDAGGTCSENGVCQWQQYEPVLSIQIYELLTSLGVKVRRSSGKDKDGYTYFSLQFFISDFEVFKLQSKLDNQKDHVVHAKHNRHYIRSIEKVDSVPVRCIMVDNEDHMFLCGDFVPTHNSTIAAMMLEWVANFFPGTQIVILNMSKSAAQENLNKIKGIHYHLPSFLKTGLKDNGNYKTYLEYENGSVIKTFFYSTTTSPDTMARSLTAPILYTDEIAFIPKFSEMWGSAQPVLSKAREQAELNGYPYFTLITSTPNGTAGTGKFFHEMWGNALPSEQIFKTDSTFEENSNKIISSPSHNSFIRIRYHWSEIRPQEWYQQQCRELNFDKRKINQELDLLFVGGTGCIFDDDFLSELAPTAPKSCVTLPTFGKLNVYIDELDAGDFYIIGVDSAKSITGDYCAIEITKYSTLEQVAEYYERVGSITKFAENIMVIVDWVTDIVGTRYVLAVENNNVGSAVIEELEKAEKDYISQMYNTNIDKGYGINTNVKTKEKMITFLYDYIVPNPSNIRSIAMIDQLSVIEKKGNGSISAQTGQHDDLFMAYALTAYAKKMTALEIEPRLDPKIAKELDKKTAQLVKIAVGPSLVGGTFENMVSGMSINDIQEYGASKKQDVIIDRDNDIDQNGNMSSIIGDIFGG